MIREADVFLEWFWFTKYDCTAEEDGNDRNIDRVRSDFMDPVSKHYRSVRFRYCLPEAQRDMFEDKCKNLIVSSECAISDFRDYDLGDLGDERHLEGERTFERIRERAKLVVNNYCSIAKLVLHAMSGPDEKGRFMLPHYTNPNQDSPFVTFHHIFCNMTDVPLHVHYIEHVPGNLPHEVLRRVRVLF